MDTTDEVTKTKKFLCPPLLAGVSDEPLVLEVRANGGVEMAELYYYGISLGFIHPDGGKYGL